MPDAGLTAPDVLSDGPPEPRDPRPAAPAGARARSTRSRRPRDRRAAGPGTGLAVHRAVDAPRRVRGGGARRGVRGTGRRQGTLMRATLHAVTAADYRCVPAGRRPMLQRHPAPGPRPAAGRPRSSSGLRGIAAAFTTRAALVDRPCARAWSSTPATGRPTRSCGGCADRRPTSTPRRPTIRGRSVDARCSWTPRPGSANRRRSLRSTTRSTTWRGATWRPSARRPAADLGQWSGRGGRAPSPGAGSARGRPARSAGSSDERGKVLVDLVDAPRPPAAVPAPPRLLPMWDSVLLAHADRTRIISDADRAVVIAKNGDTLPTFTVDGRVARAVVGRARDGGRRTRTSSSTRSGPSPPPRAVRSRRR